MFYRLGTQSTHLIFSLERFPTVVLTYLTYGSDSSEQTIASHFDHVQVNIVCNQKTFRVPDIHWHGFGYIQAWCWKDTGISFVQATPNQKPSKYG